MRPIAIILLIICLAMIGLTGYLYLTARVVITDINCAAADAADQPEVFEGLKAQTRAGTFTGIPYDTENLGAAEDYQFLTYTVELRNDTFLRAEVAEVQVTPMNGDVLQMEETTVRTIQPGTSGTAQATILTGKDMHSVRELTVTYYLWGLPFSATTTYSK